MAIGQLTDLLARIQPGTLTTVLRTPLGVLIQDPFSQDASQVGALLHSLGISLDVYMGPPRAEDLAAPSLTQNLMVAGLLVGGYVVMRRMTRRS